MRFLLLLIVFFITACSSNKVSKNHGFISLENKLENIVINKSNKNDIIEVIGQPSSISKFNSNKWFYIERKQTQSRLKNLGKMKIYENNVLVLEIDNYGLLKKKDFYDLKDMKKINIVKKTTQGNITKNSFIYDFMSSMRQKLNDPLGQRAKKRKEISQR